MKKLLSLFLVLVTVLGILPTAAFAASPSEPDSFEEVFELPPVGATAWNDGDGPLTVYTAETGSAQAASIPDGEPFALLEDNGGGRLKIGYCEGGWTGGTLESTGWVDKADILVKIGRAHV